MIFNRRHMHLSIVINVQSYNQLALSLRKTASHFCMFKPRNKKEGQNIFEELIFLDPKLQEELYRYVFQERHDFLFGDVASGKLYRNTSRRPTPLPKSTTLRCEAGFSTMR